jgi:superfamily II DNA or RNA helicase
LGNSFPRRLANDQLRWLNLKPGIHTPDAKEHASRQTRTARALLQRFFGPAAVHGVILGDEVGMGKTYEALAVIAAVFKHRPMARILVLTHSSSMADTWLERWNWFCDNTVARGIQDRFPKGNLIDDVRTLRSGQLGFASYDWLKRVPPNELRYALKRAFKGRWLRLKVRRRLVKDLFGKAIAPVKGEIAAKIPQRALDQFWKDNYDPESRNWWHPRSAMAELRCLVFRASRAKRQVDLLVVDEAHKLASHQRNMFFSEVLGGRARRALYVTATPFSLSVDQLYDRIEDMHVVTGADTDNLALLKKDLFSYRDIVRSRSRLAPELKNRLQDRLRRYLVRSQWKAKIAPGVPRRIQKKIKVDTSFSDERQANAMLALETAFVLLARIGGRTHNTTHRETLCSSYAAIRNAAERSRASGTAFAPYLKSLTAMLPRKAEHPKFDAVVDYLSQIARRREKVVVFCGRIATLTALRRALHDQLHPEMQTERNLWDRVRSRLRREEKKEGRALIDSDNLPKLRLAVHRFGDVPRGREAHALRQIQQHICEAGGPSDGGRSFSNWHQSWGSRRRIDWVGVLAGQQGDDKTNRSPEAVQFAFNLPGPPYILLCTEIAREGIDLHLWCRRIVQYDLEWNPALMEQQIGRIDRIGSLSRRKSRSIEVVWAWMPGTYEEYIAKKVQGRLEMMKVLLGAGEWIAASPEDQEAISELDRYKLNFAP